MNENIISFAIILLLSGLISALVFTFKWNRENNQLPCSKNIKNNVQAFFETIKETSEKRVVIPFAKISEMAAACTFVVVTAIFFSLNNHGRNPCDIDYIDVDENKKCSYIVHKRNMRCSNDE